MLCMLGWCLRGFPHGFKQNSSQSLPVPGMKFLISRKTWYVTTCSSSMVKIDVDEMGGCFLWICLKGG